jgi:poly-gamma-glutamate synthesis protein (capsule biosynthesis protein)
MKIFDLLHGSHCGQVFEGPHLRLCFCADWAPARRYAGAILEQPGSLYSPEVLGIIEKANFRIVNVETVLHAEPAAAKPVPKEGPNLIGPAAAVEDLLAGGFNVGLLANNHTYDFGPEGLLSTRDILEQAGLQTCGTGTSQEDAYAGLVLEAKGVSVALVNFQEGEEGNWTDRAPELAGWDLDRVCRSIRKHVAEGRVVIALPHADREFLPVPSPYAQQAYRGFVEAGASLVVAHHPHVPRGIEIHRGVPILYSQGNFIFAHDHAGLFRKLGYMVEVAVAPAGEVGCRIIPYRLDENGIYLLDTEQREWFMDQLRSVSGENLSPERVAAWWNAAIDAIPVDSWYASCTGMDYGMELMRKRDPIGLARLRTRLSGPAHYAFMIAGINRILAGHHGQSPPAMIETVRLWTETQSESLPLFG